MDNSPSQAQMPPGPAQGGVRGRGLSVPGLPWCRPRVRPGGDTSSASGTLSTDLPAPTLAQGRRAGRGAEPSAIARRARHRRRPLCFAADSCRDRALFPKFVLISAAVVLTLLSLLLLLLWKLRR